MCASWTTCMRPFSQQGMSYRLHGLSQMPGIASYCESVQPLPCGAESTRCTDLLKHWHQPASWLYIVKHTDHTTHELLMALNP